MVASDYAGLGTDGGRWMHTPDLGIYYAQTDTLGNTVIPEDRSTGTIRGDIERLVGILADAGMHQVLVHRYTEPGHPFHVVRVVVPGLEGYRFERYQPGPRGLAALAGASR